MGLRPDRAVIVYSNLIRQTYKKTPIILGGIEASLRRLAHYDYWENKVKHSVLLDSGADMISYRDCRCAGEWTAGRGTYLYCRNCI